MSAGIRVKVEKRDHYPGIHAMANIRRNLAKQYLGWCKIQIPVRSQKAPLAFMLLLTLLQYISFLEVRHQGVNILKPKISLR